MLFLADRVVLRDQAYNSFSSFAAGTSDPRRVIKGHPPNFNRDLYFTIYQTLWSENEKGQRLFQRFPRDFFDLVIIDECHRSGFGTWREILDHFETAIHLGMTATPKQAGDGVRLLVCLLPVTSPWLNPIEPKWMHGKRKVAEPGRVLSAQELADRVFAVFGCDHEDHLAISENVS